MKMTLQIQCRKCCKTYNVQVDSEQYKDWKNNGTHVQNAFPNLSADDRELLISRTCGTCFDKIFEEK